jgi:heterodisulfide reductase subunit A
MTEEPRIGVFICHCGSNIGGTVDVPKVVEYASTLPGVAYAERNLYTCADDGLKAIKNGIKEHNLNRVIVASCTPRTHAPLFQGVCEEAGLNKYLFTFVNLREHCSWVHMKEPEKATEKAKDLIRMGVARAKLLQPQEEVKVDVEPSALVIGGGISGMTAALSLANQGFPVHIVEKEKELGGFVRNLNSLYLGGGDATKFMQPLLEKVRTHPNIKVYLDSKLKSVEGFIGNYNVNIAKGAGEEVPVKVGTIIVATGAVDYKPDGLFGYGQYTNVVTLTEFERLCKEKKLPKLRNVAFIQCVGSRGQKYAYCSRICCNISIKSALNIAENYNGMLGKEEETADKIAVETKGPEPTVERRRRRRTEGSEGAPAAEAGASPATKVEVLVFNRGITAYGVEHELHFNKSREKRVRYIKYNPENLPKVTKEGDQLIVSYYHETLKADRKQPVDMVILATPLIGQPDSKTISQLLKVPIGQDGFFLEAHVKLRPVDFATEGVYVCGTAHGPADISESVQQALAAASRAGIPMARGYVQAEALTPIVNTDECVGCGICSSLCPFQAIRINKTDKGSRAEVIVAACKGCGTCGASCPEKAITMRHFTDEQLISEGIAALREVTTGPKQPEPVPVSSRSS